MKKRRYVLLLGLFVLAFSHAASAGQGALLGIQIEYPKINFASTVSQNTLYDGTTLTVNSAPVFIIYSAGGTQEFVAAGQLTITARINSDGTFVAGPESMFSVSGTTTSYSGVIVAGNVLDYGIQDISATDLADFSLQATSGSMLDQFGTGEMGAIVSLENSSYAGSFTDIWGATLAKGDVGAIPVVTPTVGTGTIGYWKNHPEAWQLTSIDLGGQTFTKDELIGLLKTPTRGDKTISMAKQLIAAKLNVTAGNDSSCIYDTVSAADIWLSANGGVGIGLRQWGEGDLLHDDLDAYNNGLLCAPSRN